MSSPAIPENRGKSGKITADTVRLVIEEARAWKNDGKPLLLDEIVGRLSEKGVKVSRKIAGQILIANGLRAPDTRKRRPAFYQSPRRQIPNGLLGIDGSEITVWHGDTPIRFNIELATDIGTHTHTAFSIGDTETGDEVMKVLETHINDWGTPLGILCDSGTANPGEHVRDFAAGMDIELLPVGPGNPKGNGSLEGAFAHLKDVVGTVRLDISSPRALVKSVLETVIRVYVTMRNKIPLRSGKSPLENMSAPVSAEKREMERIRLKNVKAAKADKPENREKIERVRFLIRNKGIVAEPEAVKRAEKTIAYYDTEAIAEAEAAFLKAVARDPKRRSLPYFFGIPGNIQKQKENDAYAAYCREKYNYDRMREIENMQNKTPEKPDADGIVGSIHNFWKFFLGPIFAGSHAVLGNPMPKLGFECQGKRSMRTAFPSTAWERARQYENVSRIRECSRIVSLVGAGVDASAERVKRFAFNRARAWTEELAAEK